MQKVKTFLEAHVQWVALGLGLLWILFIGYSYWGKPPVSATIDGKQVGPSEVDDVAREGPIATLQKALDNKLPKPPQVLAVLNDQGANYTEKFRKKMGLTEVAVAPVQPMWPAAGEPVKDKGTTTAPTQDEKVGVPVIATGVMSKPETSNGLSVAWVPNPDKPAANAAAGAAPPPTQIGFANQPQQPEGEQPRTFVPPGAGQDVVPVMMETKDTGWITTTARWNNQGFLKDVFKKSGIPDAQAMTLFLRVRLVREEQQPDGSWGNRKYIDDLTNQGKLPWPPKNADEEGVYLDWAQKSQADIVEPAFYEVVRGTVWRTASMPDMGDVGDATADANAGPAQFDPAQVKPGEVSKLSPEQKKLWYEWKQEQDKAERERRKSEAEGRKAATPPSGGGGAGRGGAGGARAPIPANDQRISGGPVTPHGAPPSNSDGAVSPGRGGRGVPSRGVEVYGGPGATPNTGGAGGSTPSVTQTDRGEFKHGDIPQGRFNPAQVGDLEIWAHDTTAVPGHTYRYKLEVSLLNPLYKTQNLAKNPADENKFALVVESDWTAPVSVATRQRFFAVNPGGGLGGNAPNMKFDYFWWEDGKWNMKTISIQPGDAIPKTGWTMVDLKPVGNSDRENRAVLVNEKGEVVSHFYKDDVKDPDYAKLKALVAKATTPPAGGAAPGSATGFVGQ